MARMIQLSDGRVIPETEMTPEQVAYYDRQNAAELLKNNPPATPLEAAIDKATGFADAAKADVTEEADSEKEKAETEKADSGTDEAASVDDLYVKKNGRYGSPKPQPKTDWVEEAYKCFIKDAGDIDPTDPVAAVEAYFQKNATDELKARCKAEGKDAKGCWRFIEAVARKALHGSSGHIDPGVVYAIAMHWFEDVPKDWDGKAAQARPSGQGKVAKPKKPTTKKGRLEERVSHGSSKAKAELRELKKKERAKAKPKAKKPRQSQGFFFEMLETPVVGGEGRGDESPRTEQESEVQE